MGPNDVAAVLQLGPTSLNQPFTSDKTRLVASIDQFVGRKPTSATLDLLHDAMLRPQEAGVPEDAESGARASDARIMLESIKQLCQRLGTTQGHRRSIVVFGEGIDFDMSDLIGEDQRPGAGGQGLKYQPSKHAGTVLAAEEDLFVAARRANVALYTVDPRGNTAGDEDIMQAPSAPGTGLLREAQRGQGTMRTFAAETGGLSVVGTNNIASGFSRIVQANSSYYVLAYSPATARDGAYHKIAVTVKGRDVEVTARKGYFAEVDTAASGGPPASDAPASSRSPGGGAPSPRLRELLGSQLPVGGLGLRVTGGPVRAQVDKDVIGLVVELDTHALPFVESAGQLSNDIEIGFVAMDAGGKTAAANRNVGNLRLPASARAAAQNGLRYVVEFPVAPGGYQVRVAADESAGGSGGSVVLDLTAPNLTKTPLSVGTIFLAAPAGAPAMPTTGAYPCSRAPCPHRPQRRASSRSDRRSWPLRTSRAARTARASP